MDRSFTQSLLATNSVAFQRATRSSFLAAAGRGQIPKDVLGRWLANDRLYIHSYVRGVGLVLATNRFPVLSIQSTGSTFVRLVDWLIEALANVRREERFFIDIARSHGISVDLPVASNGRVPDDAKQEGLHRFDMLFANCAASDSPTLPWLEAAIVFWGTEKCYLDAWTWAKSEMDATSGRAETDYDGGVLRNKLIPNWSSIEFKLFVDLLGTIIDEAVEQQIQVNSEATRLELLGRARVVWDEVLRAEEAFWPDIS